MPLLGLVVKRLASSCPGVRLVNIDRELGMRGNSRQDGDGSRS